MKFKLDVILNFIQLHHYHFGYFVLSDCFELNLERYMFKRCKNEHLNLT